MVENDTELIPCPGGCNCFVPRVIVEAVIARREERLRADLAAPDAAQFHEHAMRAARKIADKVWRLCNDEGEYNAVVAEAVNIIKGEFAVQPAASTPTALLRDPVKVDVTGLTRACQTCGGPFGACDCLPPLVVTRNGVPCADQKVALEEFKQAAAASTEAQNTYLDCAMCGAPNSFVIDPRDPSTGYCFVEKQAWHIASKTCATKGCLQPKAVFGDYCMRCLEDHVNAETSQ